MAAKTIFKKIIDREIPANIVYEDEQCLAFHDINAQAPIHLLIIPKKEIASVAEIEPEDEPLIGHLFSVARRLAAQFELTDGYRVVTNCGKNAGQEVFHIHFHLLGGRSFTWPPG